MTVWLTETGPVAEAESVSVKTTSTHEIEMEIGDRTDAAQMLSRLAAAHRANREVELRVRNGGWPYPAIGATEPEPDPGSTVYRGKVRRCRITWNGVAAEIKTVETKRAPERIDDVREARSEEAEP